MMSDNQWDKGLNARDRRNVRPIKIHALLWSVFFLVAALVLPAGGGDLESQPAWAWAIAALPIPFAVMLAHHYLRFIRETDELMKKIHLEALAAGFGVAFVVGMGFILLGQLGLSRFAGLSWYFMLLAYIWKLRSAQKEYHA